MSGAYPAGTKGSYQAVPLSVQSKAVGLFAFVGVHVIPKIPFWHERKPISIWNHRCVQLRNPSLNLFLRPRTHNKGPCLRINVAQPVQSACNHAQALRTFFR